MILQEILSLVSDFKHVQLCLKKLLVKAIIAFSIIYFKSYRKIAVRSNKSIP